MCGNAEKRKAAAIYARRPAQFAVASRRADFMLQNLERCSAERQGSTALRTSRSRRSDIPSHFLTPMLGRQ